MRHQDIPYSVLLTETLRLLPRFLLLILVLALAYAVAHVVLGYSNVAAVVVALFFALVFFVAPMAASSGRARRAVRLFSRSGLKTLLFCFAWGGIVVAGFVATLQVWQGMDASVLDYAVAIAAGGACCALMAAIPSR